VESLPNHLFTHTDAQHTKTVACFFEISKMENQSRVSKKASEMMQDKHTDTSSSVS
jgi:hypothetical protein